MSDQKERTQALDPSASFIVQAPAGSGKTELLTQRYLVLLSYAAEPEEILAITFTRKAASEMRMRILNALEKARDGVEPESFHQQQTWSLARRVLERSVECNWNILDNSNRLRIQTIDALSAKIVSNTPVLSDFGFVPRINNDVSRLYQLAARNILSLIHVESPWLTALSTVLLYLDNDHTKVEKLLVAMLERRDQWLAHVMNDNPRDVLEAALCQVIEDALTQLQALFSKESKEELLTLYRFATGLVCHELPDVKADALSDWFSLIQFLLTQEGKWRKKFTIREGFPASAMAKNAEEKKVFKEMKERMMLLIHSFQETEQLLIQMQRVLSLPAHSYTEAQWSFISALVTLLPIAVAELNTLFQDYEEVDYLEIASRAIQALGTEEQPTDLSLILDQRLQHILVDEFQDTSIMQFRLLERLTQGWQEGEGRTLFLVGDPMQSIYRFRKAEVALFLEAKYKGINGIRLLPLTLSINFRSQTVLVDWFNQVFTSVFPKKDDFRNGAIAFHPAVAQIEASEEGVFFHTVVETQESEKVVRLVQEAWRKDPKQSVGILVLARHHLVEILPSLQAAGISYQAVEIEKLSRRRVIQDLLALTRALLHPADRIAWLAILRAPWCGLVLSDLLLLVGENLSIPIWNRLQEPLSEQISADGAARLARIIPILRQSIEQRCRQDLAIWVESTWLNLGGPACLEEIAELQDAETFFKLLNELEQEGGVTDFAYLEGRLSKLFANPTLCEPPYVEVMTIHKAKGLEFNTVILPTLAKQTRRDEHQLLLWQEVQTQIGKSELLLAPIKTGSATENREDAIYDYLRSLENEKLNYEMVRLLYVAVSRAKNALHLIGRFEKEEDTLKKPMAGTFLEKLWGPCHRDFITAFQDTEHELPPVIKTSVGNGPAQPQPYTLSRLPVSWKLEYADHAVDISQFLPAIELGETLPNFSWKNEIMKRIGIVLHKIFCQLSTDQESQWRFISGGARTALISLLLRHQGISNSELSDAVSWAEEALVRSLRDPRGQWLFDPNHEGSQAEFALTVQHEKQVMHLVIDRTFVDNNTRWIIDYKFSTVSLEDERYLAQLEKYANAMRQIESRPIRVGLYWPLASRWSEWKFTETGLLCDELCGSDNKMFEF